VVSTKILHAKKQKMSRRAPKNPHAKKSYHEITGDKTPENILIRPYKDGDVFLGETREKTMWTSLPQFVRPARVRDGTIRTAPICEPWGSYIFDIFSHEDLLLDEKVGNLVALSDTRVIGVCLFDAKFKEILVLCVHPEFRKSNLGSTLLTRVLQLMGNVEVSLTSSPEAIRFYQRHGFVICSESTAKRTDDFTDMILPRPGRGVRSSQQHGQAS
jgi:ribosomal protein S18 acetylase RimI-like enzyme